MIEIGDIRKASRLYMEMVSAWKKFDRGEGRTDNYAKVIGNALAICKLDLPDPFMLLEPQSAEEKVKPEDPAIVPAIIISEDVAEAKPEQKAEPEQKQQRGKWFKGGK